MAESLELAVQGTPNPNAIKITLNRTVAAHGRTYRDQATAADGDWNVIGPQAQQVLRQAFA